MLASIEFKYHIKINYCSCCILNRSVSKHGPNEAPKIYKVLHRGKPNSIIFLLTRLICKGGDVKSAARSWKALERLIIITSSSTTIAIIMATKNIEPLLCSRCSSKGFMCIKNSFDPQSSPMSKILLLSPFYRRGNMRRYTIMRNY